MAEYPLLFFPQPAPVTKSRRPGRARPLHKPTAAQQRQRLHTRFQRIVQSLQSVQSGVQGLVPEQVIVLETIGDSVEGLSKAASQIEGLEWLAEMDLDDVAPVGGFASADDSAARLPCRLYTMMSNQRAMQELLSLWDRWTQSPEERARQGFGPFKQLFQNLRDVRRWAVQDRISATRVLDYLQERLQYDDEQVQFEVELWCRREASRRQEAYDQLTRVVSHAGGRCERQFALPTILYHGVLVSMAAPAVKELIDQVLSEQHTELVRCEHVMFFRPHGQASFPVAGRGTKEPSLADRMKSKPLPQGAPVAAILDGLPLEQHVALRGRITVDDPEEHGEEYQATEQQHGTAMASMVIHGELGRDEMPLASSIYCRPIFLPVRLPNKVDERVAERELLVDLIHRAVLRIIEGDDGPAAAPGVRVINLSFGDPYRPFDRDMSPLARLLDWLAWKYRLLFLVSAGNQLNAVSLDISLNNFKTLSPQQQTAKVLQAIHADQVARRNYSPSESLNAVTVGAVHVDASQPRSGDRRFDLVNGDRLPSPLTTVCNGFRRSVKPDVMFPGGRQLYMEDFTVSADKPAKFEVSQTLAPPGQQVAWPGVKPMSLDHTAFTRGTSNATALASRTACRINERLEEMAAAGQGAAVAVADRAVLLKCLLAHAADWGSAGYNLDAVFQEIADNIAGGDSRRRWQVLEGIKSRFLGFGEVIPERSLHCTDERVTLLGWGSLQKDAGDCFEFPLPGALSGERVSRKLTVTLAWLSPLNFQSQKYRQAQLWFNVDEKKIRAAKRGLNALSAQRGTIEHRVFEGKGATPVVEGDVLEIRVNCREDAGGLSCEVPYALAVTLEVAQPLKVSIYKQISQQIGTRIGIDTMSR